MASCPAEQVTSHVHLSHLISHHMGNSPHGPGSHMHVPCYVKTCLCGLSMAGIASQKELKCSPANAILGSKINSRKSFVPASGLLHSEQEQKNSYMNMDI